MAFDAHPNFAVSLVVGPPSPAASGTTLTVTAGEGGRFASTPFNAVVCPRTAVPTPQNAEVVRVTNRSADTLTIVRAQEGSSARTITVGDRIFAAVTAKSFTDIESLVAPTFAFVTSTVATTFANGVVTFITFDTVVADSDGFWSPGQPTRLTIPPGKAGLYFIHGNIEFQADTAGERLVGFRRNSSVTFPNGEPAIGGGSSDLGHGESYVPSTIPTDTPQVHANTPAVLEEGDYVEMFGLAVGLSVASIDSRHVPPNTPHLYLDYKGPV